MIIVLYCLLDTVQLTICIVYYRTLLHDVMRKKINAELAIQKKITNWEEILTVSAFVK